MDQFFLTLGIIESLIFYMLLGKIWLDIQLTIISYVSYSYPLMSQAYIFCLSSVRFENIEWIY